MMMMMMIWCGGYIDGGGCLGGPLPFFMIAGKAEGEITTNKIITIE